MTSDRINLYPAFNSTLWWARRSHFMCLSYCEASTWRLSEALLFLLQATRVGAPDSPPVGDRQPGGGSAGGPGLDLHRHQTRKRLYRVWERIVCVQYCFNVDLGFCLKNKIILKLIDFIVLCFSLRLSDGHGDWASQTRGQIRNDRLRKHNSGHLLRHAALLSFCTYFCTVFWQWTLNVL